MNGKKGLAIIIYNAYRYKLIPANEKLDTAEAWISSEFRLTDISKKRECA